MKGCLSILAVVAIALVPTLGFAAGVDLTLTEIRFAPETPKEGDGVTISAAVRNDGDIALTSERDIDVAFFEGPPGGDSLQIQSLGAVAGLEPGQEKVVKAKFRPRAGHFEIHAVLNPDPTASKIFETNRNNNELHNTLTVAAKTFPKATPQQIQAAKDKAIQWVLSQQGEFVVKCPQDGTENPVIVPACVVCGLTLAGLPVKKKESPAWSPTEGGPAATSLAIMTLLASGLKPSHSAIDRAIQYLLAQDWNNFDVYDFSVIIPALVATGQREKYRDRVQFAVNRLIGRQLRVENGAEKRDDGGWGYGAVGDGAHMQYAIYALYTAKQWGVEIPRVVWERAEKWVRSTQHHLGGWNYNLIDSPWGEGPYGSMTATGMMALRMMGVPLTDPQLARGMQWMERFYTVTSNPGSYHWHHYFLVSILRAMDIPPAQKTLGGHDWYQEFTDYWVATQYPDGRWEENGDAYSSTCFGILFLSRYMPKAQVADLSVVPSSLKLSPPSPAEGTPIAAQFTVVNLGKPTDKPIAVAVYEGDPQKGGKLLQTQEVLFPAGRADATVTVSWKAPRAGPSELFIVADPKKQLPDQDRSNNAASLKYEVVSATASAEERAKTQLVQLAPNVFQIGTVILDRNKKEARIPGQVWRTNVMIEYLATGLLGKAHETVFVLDVEPIVMQTALLGLGLEADNNLRAQGDARTPRGAPVELWVTWKVGGKERRLRAEETVLDIAKGRPMTQTHWVFTGSRFQGAMFMAEATKNLIATYRDPDAILNHPLPEGANDAAYRANTAILPPKGTPITLTIRPVEVTN